MKTICVITTSRADYSHLIWPMRAIQAHADLELCLIVTGAHLSPEFGHSVELIELDGFEIRARPECLLSSDSDSAMAKTIGVAMLSLTDLLADIRPDVLLLIADRYEMLAPASVATALRIPIAHIEGGEISEGAIDDAIRNALTKLSHIHFTPTAQASAAVEKMGEAPWRIHQVGAPSLDHLTHSQLPGLPELENHLGRPIQTDRQTIVVAYHPVTLLTDTTREAEALFLALDEIDADFIFCWPNADAGSRAIMRRAQHFCDLHEGASTHVNLPAEVYWALLREAHLMVGNSSSGIMETASLGLPTINIGFRQAGRLRADNVIDADADTQAIVCAIRQGLAPEFRASVAGMDNPYGSGHAGEQIAATLAQLPDPETLLRKRR